MWEEGRVVALSHMYAVKSPLVTIWRAPNSAPTVPFLYVDRSPNATTCLISRPVRLMMPNGIRIRSAVFPQCTEQTDAPTHRPTDCSRESMITIGRERRGLIILIYLLINVLGTSHILLQVANIACRLPYNIAACTW